MATFKIRMGNRYRRYIWYPIMNLLGRMRLMDRCAYCGITHYWADYSVMKLDNDLDVLVCTCCADMSHEPWFNKHLNEHTAKGIITPLMIVGEEQ